MAFRLYLKSWGFPVVQSSFLPCDYSHSKQSSSYLDGKRTCFDMARLSLPSISYGETDGTIANHPKACTFSSSLQSSESRYSDQLRETKVSFGEDEARVIRRFQVSSASHYHLLLENLQVLQETFDDSQVVRLETDILVLLERLGALKLFHVCLSRTLNGSFCLESAESLLADTERHKKDIIVAENTSNVIVRSGKKEERKSRREGALMKLNRNTVLSLPKDVPRRVGRPSPAKKPFHSKKRKSPLIKNEADLATGVKVIAHLESIKARLDKELSRPATMDSWAEAAGIDKQLLQQQLRFGWYCKDELLRSTRSLVLYIAKSYKVVGVSFDDLIQAGKVGVLKGAERYDQTRGYKFSTYVQYWIRKWMSALVSQHVGGILIPPSVSRVTSQIAKARVALKKGDGHHPTDAQIADFTGISSAKIQEASQYLRVVGSIDKKMGDNLNIKFMEFTPDMSVESPEVVVMLQHMRKDINELLHGLDQTERKVLSLRHGLGDHRWKSLQEIGDMFGVSKEWIRKVERRAFRKVRSEEKTKFISHYLE